MGRFDLRVRSQLEVPGSGYRSVTSEVEDATDQVPASRSAFSWHSNGNYGSAFSTAGRCPKAGTRRNPLRTAPRSRGLGHEQPASARPSTYLVFTI